MATSRIEHFLSDVYSKCSVIETKKTLTNIEWINQRINMANKSELMYIFSIILTHRVQYSQTSNGIFFDINNISDEAFTEILEYLKNVK